MVLYKATILCLPSKRSYDGVVKMMVCHLFSVLSYIITVMSLDRHGYSDHTHFHCLFNSFSGWKQQNIKTPYNWAFVRGIHQSPVVSSHTNGQGCGKPWWRHQMETFSALLAICAGNSPVTGHKGQWRGALMFFFNWVSINGSVNNGEAGD